MTDGIIQNPYEITFMQSILEQVKIIVADYNEANNHSGFEFDQLSFTPNYHYLKFTPQNEEQEAALKESGIPLVDYPLKYVDYSHYAFVENLPMPEETDIATYWTGIDKTISLPEVPYEVIEEMYVPDEDAYFANEPDNEEPTEYGRIDNKEDLVAHIYTLAFQQSGNQSSIPPDVLIPDPDSGLEVKFLGISFRSKWTPYGIVQLWDNIAGSTTTTHRTIIGYEYFECPDNYQIADVTTYDPYQEGEEYGAGSTAAEDTGNANDGSFDLEPIDSGRQCRRPIYQTHTTSTSGGFVPLGGAQILVRDTFTLGNAITNDAGFFQFRRFRVALRHHIQWERKQYSIRDGLIAQAMLRGPKLRKQPWFVGIAGGEDQIHADIHRAAHMMYYVNIPGLSTPPENTTWRWQMKLCALEHLNFIPSHHLPFRRFVGLGQIWMKVAGKTQEQVLGLTFHELAHAIHWKVTTSTYNDLVWRGYIDPTASQSTIRRNRRLIESYATHLEIAYTNEFYRRLGRTTHRYLGTNLQDRTINDDIYYTTGIFDLTETENQRTTSTLRPIDNAEGYSLPQLELALKNADHWDEYADRIILYGIDNPADIRELFANWPQ